MLGNTLRSWSGWMDPSTACTCECASRHSGNSQPISPQTADDMSPSSDTYEQPCTVSSVCSSSITVLKGKKKNHTFFSSTVIIKCLEQRCILYRCCHTFALIHLLQAVDPSDRGMFEWWVKQLLLFDFPNTGCKLLHKMYEQYSYILKNFLADGFFSLSLSLPIMKILPTR